MQDKYDFGDMIIAFVLGVCIVLMVVVTFKISTKHDPVKDYTCQENGLSIKIDSNDEPERWVWIPNFKCKR